MVEVAHDYQVQVKKYVCDELKLRNSFDTWHGVLLSVRRYVVHVLHLCICVHEGTKNVAKKMAKIAQGPVRSEGVTWFRQLSDKRKLFF